LDDALQELPIHSWLFDELLYCCLLIGSSAWGAIYINRLARNNTGSHINMSNSTRNQDPSTWLVALQWVTLSTGRCNIETYHHTYPWLVVQKGQGDSSGGWSLDGNRIGGSQTMAAPEKSLPCWRARAQFLCHPCALPAGPAEGRGDDHLQLSSGVGVGSQVSFSVVSIS
jgi:hypothetical protein